MTKRGKVTLLLFVFCVCTTAVLVHFRARLQPDPFHPSELFEAIQSQLAAVRSDNVSSAYRQASSTFQQQWSLDEYSSMTRTEYARMRQATRIEFGAWQQRGRHAMVEVFFVNPEGNVSPCIFTLIHEAELWKVDGARWIKDWPVGRRIRGIRS